MRGLHGWAAMALVLAAALSACGEEAPDPAPTAALARVIRGELVLEREGYQVRVLEPARVEVGATATTAEDAQGIVTMDTGAWALLDRSSSALVTLGHIEHQRGRLWLDATGGVLSLSGQDGLELEAEGATFAIEEVEGGLRVYCASGEVTFRSEAGEGQLMQGEMLSAESGEVSPAGLWDDWTGGLADPTPPPPPPAGRIGALFGRIPGSLGEARTPLPIRSHTVAAQIQGDFVETEVTQTFFNAESDSLETEYAVRIPHDAIVRDFAVDRGTGFVEGVVRPMQLDGRYGLNWQGHQLTETRLVYDGRDRLRARIHPVAPGETLRVRLRYAEWMPREGNMRTYRYPMRSEGVAPLVGELSIRVDTSRANVGAMRAGMGATVEGSTVVLRQSDVRPGADFFLNLLDPADASAERPARAYVTPAGGVSGEGEAGYVMFDIPSPWSTDEEAEARAQPLEIVVVVDASGGTSAENLELARGAVDALLGQLAPQDRLTLRFADVALRTPETVPEAPVPVTPELRESLVEAVSRADVGGASDLGETLRDAAELVARRPRGFVLYLGDGVPTTGALDRSSIREVLAAVDGVPRMAAFGLGDGANEALLEGLFGEAALPIRSRTEAAEAISLLLAQVATPVLTDVEVDLGEEVERVYPQSPFQLVTSEPLRVVARLAGDLPERLAVRGFRDGEPFELELPVSRGTINDQGDIRRRWAVARLAELLDEDAGREALVELGTRYSVLTPWTALVVQGGAYYPVEGFDEDPFRQAWSRTGGEVITSVAALEVGGWQRRVPRSAPQVRRAVESTWVRRAATGARPAGDGGLAQAAVLRALQTASRGPDACYERKLVVRPGLSGQVQVEVEVDGSGLAREVRVASSSLGAPDVDECIRGEVEGIRFPATGASTTVVHAYVFASEVRAIGAARRCSRASFRHLDARRRLWRERLRSGRGVRQALDVWQRSLLGCELDDWRSRRTLLDMLLGHVGSTEQQVALYEAFGTDAAVAQYLRRQILAGVSSPQDVVAVRLGLGLEPPVDWSVFAADWEDADDDEERLTLVERWLEVIPEDLDLRLRRLALLEALDKDTDARRLARSLLREPLADAAVLTDVGEFWLRQDERLEARRVFSELVERAPLNPWARKRLGDLYRAHGWYDDAYREYRTLLRLDPANDAVLLDLARAAAGTGRLDEALRLEQRLSERAEPGEGSPGVTPSAVARLWTQVRLARLSADAPNEVRPLVEDRLRSSGLLRDPPDALAVLTWSHPDDRPTLHTLFPGRGEQPANAEDDPFEAAPFRATGFGLEAVPLREREPGDYVFEIRREDEDRVRDVEGELLVWVAPGRAEARVHRVPVRLGREDRRIAVRLDASGELEDVSADRR